MNQNENDEMEIDLLDLAYMLLDNWHYLLICLLAGAVTSECVFIFLHSAYISVNFQALRSFYVR